MKPGKNELVVRRFIDAVSDKDRERVLSFFSEDSIFQSEPDAAAVGQRAIWDVLASIHDKADDVELQLHSIAENDQGCVLTERTERYLIDGDWCEYNVKGTFQVKGCKILEWREDLVRGLVH